MLMRAFTTIAVLVLGAVALFLIWAVVMHDPRKDIDLANWVGPQNAWEREMMPHPRWATDELCGDDPPCIQSVTSDRLTMYRFADRDQAVAAAESLGDDGYLTGWIVVGYEPGALTESQRYDFEYSVSCINTWVGEEGQDC